MDPRAILARFLRLPQVAAVRAPLDVYGRAAGGLLARGLAFSALFALVPTLLLVLGLVGWVAGDAAARDRISATLSVAVAAAGRPDRRFDPGLERRGRADVAAGRGRRDLDCEPVLRRARRRHGPDLLGRAGTVDAAADRPRVRRGGPARRVGRRLDRAGFGGPRPRGNVGDRGAAGRAPGHVAQLARRAGRAGEPGRPARLPAGAAEDAELACCRDPRRDRRRDDRGPHPGVRLPRATAGWRARRWRDRWPPGS